MSSAGVTRKGALLCVLLLLTVLSRASSGSSLEPFTLAEEIGLAHFKVPFYSTQTLVSPDGHYVALLPAERGLLKLDLIEDELRIYDIAALGSFVRQANNALAPAPVLDLVESTYKEGPIISQIQWLPDSRGVAFLLKDAQDNNQLAVMSLDQSRPRVLSLKGQDVTTFDVRDSTHYVYTAFSPGSDLRAKGADGWTAMVGTGRPLDYLLFPAEMEADFKSQGGTNGLRSVLWAAIGGAPHAVTAGKGRERIVVYPIGRWLALSPDGKTVATSLPVQNIPEKWVKRFLPPYPKYPYRMRAGWQNLDASISAGSIVDEYVLINLLTKTITPINGAPTGFGNGWWWSVGAPTWSYDGKALLLANAYRNPSGNNGSVGFPCAAIFYPEANVMHCLKPLTPPHNKNGDVTPGFSIIGPLSFVEHRSDRVVIRFLRDVAHVAAGEPELLVRSRSGTWQSAGDAEKSHGTAIEVYIKQGLNQSPVVVAKDPRTKISRVVWDPNPQLKHIALGNAIVYQWKDAAGRTWTGGLYKPVNYVPGRHYPLVIQTHGFSESEFHPSGMYSTAFAARALAAGGMMVLQLPLCPIYDTPKEGPCNVAGFEAAVSRLASQGLIDPNRVGIIGFSRTVYHVLEALTTSQLPVAAASVTDGVNFGYWQYISWVDDDASTQDADAVIGGEPFGPGLQLWLRRSPEFNMRNVRTPLLVVALGRGFSLLTMWEPYAALRLLGKPVALVLLNSDEHVVTNPAVRMASQGGSVDWFRFWLQGYEDPSPVKTDQYRGWEKLCNMQKTENPDRQTFCPPTRR